MFLYCIDCCKIHAKFRATRTNDYLVNTSLVDKDTLGVASEVLANLGSGQYTCPIVTLHKSKTIYFKHAVCDEDIQETLKLFGYHEAFSRSMVQYIDLEKLSPDQILLVNKVFEIN